jgi:redox-sensitive bicupin YhaK (pirin superfamily)
MTSHARTVAATFRGHDTSDGAGVKLTRVLSPEDARLTDPFLLFDEFRSDRPEDYDAGFPPHPHRGFETVTYVMAGRMRHRDNHGNQGDLGPGSVQWMTAGRGIVHEEMPQQERGLMWGYQLWVNLPAARKMTAPRYQDVPAERIPEVGLPGGGKARVLAGRLAEVAGPVSEVAVDPAYLDVSLPAGAAFRWSPPAGHTVLLHGVEGDFTVGEGGSGFRAREMALLSRTGDLVVRAGGGGARFLVIAGLPLGEPVAHLGPFVMNTRQEIQQAIEDFQAGRF